MTIITSGIEPLTDTPEWYTITEGNEGKSEAIENLRRFPIIIAIGLKVKQMASPAVNDTEIPF